MSKYTEDELESLNDKFQIKGFDDSTVHLDESCDEYITDLESFMDLLKTQIERKGYESFLNTDKYFPIYMGDGFIIESSCHHEDFSLPDPERIETWAKFFVRVDKE